MINFSAPIEKFGSKGEKTGWTYVLIPQAIAEQLKPGMRQSFRVKGKLDEVAVEHLALIPMGEGDFIIPLKTDLRRKLRKQKGATLQISIEADDRPLPMSEDFLACLEDEPHALEQFKKLPGSHQRYYSKWIEEAKTEATKAKRIAQAIKGLSARLDFGAMTKLK
jgi:Domain of unknown function (DUF1905)/Bacteriocin-protection, YdeI or OmpD-Associated